MNNFFKFENQKEKTVEELVKEEFGEKIIDVPKKEEETKIEKEKTEKDRNKIIKILLYNL